MRPVWLVCLVGVLAACVPQEEIERAIAAQQQQDCLAAGFEPDTDPYRLCLLLQDTNRDIAALERRLDYIELNQRRIESFGPWWWR